MNNFKSFSITDAARETLSGSVKLGNVEDVKGFPVTPGGPEMDVILHDTAVTFGNSGGPLLDNCYRVIGINTLIIPEGVTNDLRTGQPTGTGNIIKHSTCASHLLKAIRDMKYKYSILETIKPCGKILVMLH